MIDGFVITKVLQSLLLPPSIIIAMIGLGFMMIKKRPHLGKAFILAGFLTLYLLGIEPVADALIRPLESAFPPVKDVSLYSPATIVILSAGVKDLSWLDAGPEPTNGSLSRLIYGIALYRQMHHASIVISGGSGDPQKQNISEADAMKDAAVSLGIPAGDIVIERGSRNTVESAEVLKKLVGKKKVVLVTSAYHMKRAVAIYRKTGMEVTPAPADYLSEQKGISLYSFIPKTCHMGTATAALSEHMSFAWYRLRGKL